MHHKRKRARTAMTRRYSTRALDRMEAEIAGFRWLSNWPRQHDILFHSRPRRRETRHLEASVLRGEDPDGINWPLGNSRPHIYYW